jgi:myb proto-oncogene protein
MSVSANGLGSARKPVASSGGQGMLTLMEDAASMNPSAVLPAGDEPCGVRRDSADTSGDRKSLGSR